MPNKTMQQIQAECHKFRDNMAECRSILLLHYLDGDWRRFRDPRRYTDGLRGPRASYKSWASFAKNEYGISRAHANRMLHAALIEQELGLPAAIRLRESVLRVLWSVDRDIIVNKRAYGIAQGMAARQALAKGRKKMAISASTMEQALLIACVKCAELPDERDIGPPEDVEDTFAHDYDTKIGPF